MKKLLITSTVVIGLAVGFACGWVVSQVQNVGKLSPSEVLANNWVTGITLLVRNGRSKELVSPEKTQSIVGAGLNIDSKVLGREYDDMPKAVQERIMFYIPAAHTIATTRLGSDQEYSDLLTFTNCMQKMELIKGGLVRECVEKAQIAASSRQTAQSVDARLSAPTASAPTPRR
jgi:hypothetical protein